MSTGILGLLVSTLKKNRELSTSVYAGENCVSWKGFLKVQSSYKRLAKWIIDRWLLKTTFPWQIKIK